MCLVIGTSPCLFHCALPLFWNGSLILFLSCYAKDVRPLKWIICQDDGKIDVKSKSDSKEVRRQTAIIFHSFILLIFCCCCCIVSISYSLDTDFPRLCISMHASGYVGMLQSTIQLCHTTRMPFREFFTWTLQISPSLSHRIISLRYNNNHAIIIFPVCRWKMDLTDT